jgi:predicted HicB family RNase H-like nuclease
MKATQPPTTFSYLGYRAAYEYDANANMWTGSIHQGNIFIEFGSDTEQEAEEEFHSLVDSYLKDCAESGEKPEPPDDEVGSLNR